MQAGHRDGIQCFDQRDAVVPLGRVAADAAHHDHGHFCGLERVNNTVDVVVRGRDLAGRRISFGRRKMDFAFYFGFLHADVEAHIYGAVWRGLSDLPGTQYRFNRCLGRAGCVVPFYVVADDRCLIG